MKAETAETESLAGGTARTVSAEADVAASGRRGLVLAAWPYGLLLLVGLFVLLPKLGDYGFWDPWEPKYAESAREMLERGSYAVAYYRDEVRLTKPILAYWGILAGAAVFGLNEFGARIVGVGFAIASMLGVFYAVSMLRGRQAGLLAALVLGTVPHFFFIARQATPDVYLFTSLGTCLLFFALGLSGPKERRDVHFGISYLGFALAVLAKGPIIAGAVFFITLALYAAGVVDLGRLWRPELRGDTIRFLATSMPAALLAPLFAGVAFLFGLPRSWWGYSGERREQMAGIRELVLDRSGRIHLAELLLVLTALVAAGAAVRLFRSASSRSGTGLGAASAIVCVSSLVALAALGPAGRILVAASLGLGASTLVLVLATRRLLLRPALRSVISPFVRPLARQVLLFVGVFIVVAGPWHLAIVIKQGHGYFTDFILKHNVARFGDEINSSGTTDFYLRTLVFGYFPWSCIIPVAVASAVAWWERDPVRRYGVEIYMLLSCAVIFAAFGLAETKFAHYLSPMIIPMSVLIGITLDRMISSRHAFAARVSWIAAAMFLLMPIMDLTREDRGFKYLVGTFTVKRYVPESLEPGAYVVGILGAMVVLLLVTALLRARILVGGLVLCGVLFAQYNTATFIPKLSDNKTMKGLVETFETLTDGKRPLGFHGATKHGMYFYTANSFERLRTRDSFVQFMNPDRLTFAVIEQKEFSDLNRKHRARYKGDGLDRVYTGHLSYILVASRPVEPD